MLNIFNISYVWLNVIYKSNKTKFFQLTELKYLFPNFSIFLSRTDIICSFNIEYFYFYFFFFKKHMNLRYTALSDLICLDLLRVENRFQIFYYLLSYLENKRLAIQIFVNELAYTPSLTFVYKSAVWYEREAWDMFGIFFKKNQDMRRLLTDYGFIGHPLRKDFPLSGFVEIFFDDWQKKLIYEKVSFAQEYRMFHFDNPWRHPYKLPPM